MAAEEKSGDIKKVTFEKNIRGQFSDEELKKCQLGNVIFPKKEVPFYTFLTNYKNINSLGCENNTFPTYKDGKYCCKNKQYTPQEALDYINNLIINALETISEEMYYKVNRELNFLIGERYRILYYNKNLDDLLTNYLKTPETLDLIDESDSFKKSINNLSIIGGKYFKLPRETIEKLGDFYKPYERLSDGSKGGIIDRIRLYDINKDYNENTTDARDEIIKLELKIAQEKKLNNDTKMLEDELNKKKIVHEKRLKLLNAAEKRKTSNVRGGKLIKNKKKKKKKKTKTQKRKRNKTKKKKIQRFKVKKSKKNTNY